MRTRSMAVVASGLLVAAVFAVATFYFAPRWLAAWLSTSAKTETGRELVFTDVEVKLLPHPALVLSQVRFANAAWGSQAWLAQADRLSASIDAAALLSGRLVMRDIAVTNAVIFLETDTSGKGNWVMGAEQSGAPAWLQALAFDEFRLQAVAVSYRDGMDDKTTSVQIDAARLAAPVASQPMQFDVGASFAGRRIEARGTIGALAALIANRPGYPVNLAGRLGAANVEVQGSIGNPHALTGLDLGLRVQAPEVADLSAVFGASLAPLGTLRGAARLTGAAAAPVIADIAVDIGTPQRMQLSARGELSGGIATSGGYDWHSSGIDLVVQGARLDELGAWLGRPLPALGRYRIAARATGSTDSPVLSAIDIAVGGRASGTPEIRLQGAIANLRTANGVDLQLQATADDWWRVDALASGLRLPPFRASARVRGAQGGYSVDGLDLSIADSRVSASLQVARVGTRLRVTGKVASPLVDLAHLPPATASTPAATAASSGTPDHWRLADVDLGLNIGRLVLPDGRELRSGSGRLAIADGRLTVSALQATLGGARVKLDGGIADPQGLAGLDLGISVQGGELAELLKFFGTSIAPVGPYQGRAQLRGSLDAPRLTAIDASVGRPGQSLQASGQIADAAKKLGVDLAVAADIKDSTAAGRLFGLDLPRLPPLKAAARFTAPQGSYVFDDLLLTLGRTSARGRAAFAPGAARPRVTAKLGGALLDLSELPGGRTRSGGTNPLLAADLDADLRFERVVLPDRRALGPVSGAVQLTAGVLEVRDFSVAVDGARATVAGRINDPLALSGIDLLVNAELTRGTGLAAFGGLGARNLPAFTASAKLRDVPGGYALADLKLVTAITTIAGEVTATRGAKRFKVVAKASSPLLDVSAFVRQAAAASAPAPASGGARAIADVPLPLDVLRIVDAELDLRIDALRLDEKAPMGPLSVRATLASGRLLADPVQLVIQPGQRLTGSASVDAAKAAWSLQMAGAGIDLGNMLARFGRPALVTGGRTDMALHLNGQGNSLAAILGSLNGDARVQVDAFQVNGFAVDLNTPLVLRLLGSAIPTTRTDPETRVKCLAARVPVSNGVFRSERNVAAETSKYNAVLSGVVDLRTEAIDIVVTPVASSGPAGAMGTVPVVVHLGGTLALPSLSVDPVGVAVKSVARVGGLWMLDALVKGVASDKSPCATALSP